MDSSNLTSGRDVTAIDKKALKHLQQIRNADIVIGIPSYESLKSIGKVVCAGKLGLAKYFPQYKGVIIVSEGGAAKDTLKVINALDEYRCFEQALIPTPDFETETVVMEYLGTPGKGSAVKAIFEAAKTLDARAACLIDSDIRSITPEWIELLIAPILLKGFGFVTPYYSRHKYDGTITNMIAYTLTRALYGRRVRQPIGGDFGFSLQLVDSLLSKKDVWETDIARFGIDIWMTTVAICEDFRVCQSFLGAKIHEAKDPGKDLDSMFKQVVGTLFSLMQIYQERWLYAKGSRPTAIFGFESESSPEPVDVDLDVLIEKFRTELPKHMSAYDKVLEAENRDKILEVANMNHNHFELPFELWVKSVYDFAVAYKTHPDTLDAKDIIEALLPLYFAAIASFVKKTEHMSTQETEEVINHQCAVFEKLKPYLVSRWNLN